MGIPVEPELHRDGLGKLASAIHDIGFEVIAGTEVMRSIDELQCMTTRPREIAPGGCQPLGCQSEWHWVRERHSHHHERHDTESCHRTHRWSLGEALGESQLPHVRPGLVHNRLAEHNRSGHGFRTRSTEECHGARNAISDVRKTVLNPLGRGDVTPPKEDRRPYPFPEPNARRAEREQRKSPSQSGVTEAKKVVRQSGQQCNGEEDGRECCHAMHQ
jgi:hypothetical protein